MALAATVIQIPIGLWMIAQLPAGAQQQLLGGDLVSATLLIGAVCNVFWLLHLQAGVALGDLSSRTTRFNVLATVLVVVLMSGVLQRLRVAHEPVAQAVSLVEQ